MIKVLIIDDEPLARGLVKEYLAEHALLQLVAECGDGFEGVKAIMQHQPDLIFLDIQMPKINGFEMLELLDAVPAVIFTTAFDEFAMKAFENHAVDYLLKPFSKERFEKALQKFLLQKGNSTAQTQALLQTAAALPQQQQRVVVKTGSKIKIIPAEEIHYLEAADDYVKIITPEGSFLKNKTLSSFEQQLDARQFVRVHRSFIVNIQQINRLDNYEKDTYSALLRSGKIIAVSKTGYAKLKQVLGM
jgi:two-component system, LytTR family, response regulator